MTDVEAHAASLAQIEQLQPASFTWSGTEYPCLAGSLTRRRELEMGGLSNDSDAVLFVRAVLFLNGQPQTKEKITFKGRTLRIDGIVMPTGEPFLKLICVDINRGA